MPTDDNHYRRWGCAFEWWAHQAELEMAQRLLHPEDDGAPPRFPVVMNVVVERRDATLSAAYSHGDTLQVDATSVSRYMCAGCNQTFQRRLRACSRCMIVYYCSRDCQRAHWRSHRSLCASPMDRLVNDVSQEWSAHMRNMFLCISSSTSYNVSNLFFPARILPYLYNIYHWHSNASHT